MAAVAVAVELRRSFSAVSPNPISSRGDGSAQASSHARVARRVVFAAAYLMIQVVVIALAQRSPDHAFGFQMFSQASRIEIRLFREVERDGAVKLVPIPRNGRFRARDLSGQKRSFAWSDRVRDRTLSRLNANIAASYGFDAQVFRLQAALEDAARHFFEVDVETRALVAEIRGSRNGEAVPSTRLTARRDRLPAQARP